MSSLTTLEGSLREVYQAPSDRLVANFSSSKLYQASVGWGHIWSWIYSFLHSFTGKDYSKEKLAIAIEKTRRVFHEEFKNVQVHAKKYQEYLKLKTQNLHVNDETPYYDSRRALLHWIKATSPYASRYLLSPPEKQNDPLKIAELFSKEDLKDLRTIEFLAPLLRLETHFQGPLPLQLLYKIGCKQKLTNREIAFIEKWMKQCDEESCITAGEMDRALGVFASVFEDSLFNPVHLQRTLTDRGFKLFVKEDPQHITWRNALKPGSKLKTSNGEITLGQLLSRKSAEKDHVQVYTIQEDPTKVIWIGVNSVIAKLKEAYRNEEAGIPSAQCYEIDKKGRFAICERLEDALTDFKWQTSPQDKLLHGTDQDILTPVANLLRWCVKQKVTPEELSPDYLMFNSQGALRFARLCYLRNFSHTALEDFILETAKGNAIIYRFLMNASTMLEHASHKFYHEVVKMALNGKTDSFSEMGATYSIVDPKVIDRAEALHKDISGLQDLCEKVLKQNYSVPNENQIQLQIKKEIFKFYCENSLSGRLWPRMEEEIISRIVESLKLEKISN